MNVKRDSDASAPASAARVALEYVLLFGLCAGIPVAANWLRIAHQLVAPQDAMNGIRLFDAAWFAFGVCVMGCLFHLALSARWLVLRLPRWLLALPLMSVAALVLIFRQESADLSDQVAMRRWFANNKPSL